MCYLLLLRCPAVANPAFTPSYIEVIENGKDIPWSVAGRICADYWQKHGEIGELTGEQLGSLGECIEGGLAMSSSHMAEKIAEEFIKRMNAEGHEIRAEVTGQIVTGVIKAGGTLGPNAARALQATESWKLRTGDTIVLENLPFKIVMAAAQDAALLSGEEEIWPRENGTYFSKAISGLLLEAGMRLWKEGIRGELIRSGMNALLTADSEIKIKDLNHLVKEITGAKQETTAAGPPVEDSAKPDNLKEIRRRPLGKHTDGGANIVPAAI